MDKIISLHSNNDKRIIVAENWDINNIRNWLKQVGMTITIRPAREADQPTIVSFIQQAKINPRNLH